MSAAQVAAPTPFATDSASLARLQANLRLALSSLVYWPDARTESAVAECQVRYRDFCVANHNSAFAGSPFMFTPRSPVRPKGWLESPIDSMSILPLLRQAAAAAPDNGWFVGQLALVLIEQGDPPRAVDAVRACRGDRAWCLALRGFALHADWRFPDADAAFAEALTAMTPERRCQWRDIAPLLDAESRRAYSELDCEARVAFEDRVWWLADPLYAHAGNDRKTEHFARRVRDSLYSGSISAFGRPWDRGLGDMLQRFGMPSHWIVAPDWAHHESPSYHFIPSMQALRLGSTVEPEHWNLSVPFGEVTERYHTGYGHLAPLSHAQIVAFPRGDSMQIVAAVDLDDEPIGAAAPFVAALAFGRDHGAPMRISPLNRATDRASMTMKAAREDVLVSLEAMSSEWQVAGRLRFTLQAPPTADGPALSSLLLFTPQVREPSTLHEAASRMVGTHVLLRNEPVGVYWEAYRFPAGMAATTTVTVAPMRIRSGLMTRIGRALGLADKPGNVLVRWTTPSLGVGEGVGHSIAVRLGELELGTYMLTVAVETRDGASAQQSRVIEVASRRAPVPEIEAALQQPVPRTSSSTPSTPIKRRETPIPPP